MHGCATPRGKKYGEETGTEWKRKKGEISVQFEGEKE